MLRSDKGATLLAVAMVALSLLPQAAGAAQVTSGVSVGLTIEPSGGHSGVRRLIFPAFVTKVAPSTRFTWNAAAISVKEAGFSQPRRANKSSLYWFYAKQRGDSFRVAVSIVSGKVIKVIPA